VSLLVNPTELRILLDDRRALGGTVGLIGTSGGLHDGHLSLIRAASGAGHFTVLWLFTGSVAMATGTLPTYDRDYTRDQRLAIGAGASVVFMPPNETLFPQGSPLVRIAVAESISEPWPECASAEFVTMLATIMAKAINVVGPCILYCGEKDWQNAMVLRRMVADLSLPAEIAVCPSIREPDGVVLGSRNQRLSPEERQAAPTIKHALDEARDLASQGEADPLRLEEAVRNRLIGVGEVEYVKVVDPETLASLSSIRTTARILVSVSFSQTSLIDSISVQVPVANGLDP